MILLVHSFFRSSFLIAAAVISIAISMSESAKSDPFSCPESPKPVECLRNTPWQCQGDAALCYAYAGADVIECGLRKSGQIQANETIDVIYLAAEYKKWLHQNTPNGNNASAKIASYGDPLGYGFSEDLIELASSGKIPVGVRKTILFTKPGEPSETWFGFQQYQAMVRSISACSGPGQSAAEFKNGEELTSQVLRILDLYARKKTVPETRIFLAQQKIHEKKIEPVRVPQFVRDVADSLARGWPILLDKQDDTPTGHSVLLKASKSENGRCLFLVDDSVHGEKWLELDQTLRLVKRYKLYDHSNEENRVRSPPSAKDPRAAAEACIQNGLCKVWKNGRPVGAYRSGSQSPTSCLEKCQEVTGMNCSASNCERSP